MCIQYIKTKKKMKEERNGKLLVCRSVDIVAYMTYVKSANQ